MRFILFAIILLISACASEKSALEQRFSCPRVGFITGATEADIQDKNIVTKITNITGECILKDGRTELDMTVVFKAEGASEEKIKSGIDFKYFIAVLSVDEKILSNEIFTEKMKFNGKGISVQEERHSIKLPIKEVEDVRNYNVVVGFVKEDKNSE